MKDAKLNKKYRKLRAAVQVLLIELNVDLESLSAMAGGLPPTNPDCVKLSPTVATALLNAIAGV